MAVYPHSEWNMLVVHTLTETNPQQSAYKKKNNEKNFLPSECLFLLNKWNYTIYLTDDERVDTPTQRETPFDSFL